MPNRLAWAIGAVPRSGTTWVSQVLTRSGLKTGHESISWNSYRQIGERAREDLGESSFAVTPHVDALRQQGTVVVHLIRPPLDSIASMWGRGLAHNLVNGGVGGLIERHCPQVYDYEGVRRFAAYWVEWNLLQWGKSDLVWRLPDFNAIDILGLAHLVGLRAVPDVGVVVNEGHNRPDVTAAMLGPDLWHQVSHYADVFGVPLRTAAVIEHPIPPPGPQVVRVNPARG